MHPSKTLRALLAFLLLTGCKTRHAEPTGQAPPEPASQGAPVEAEPPITPGMTPTDNTGEALVAAAPQITRIEIYELDSKQRLGELDAAWVAKLREALTGLEVEQGGLSMQPSWPIVLVIHSDARSQPIVAQFVDVALRVKPEDAWTEAIADEQGEIDWRIRDVYVDYELGFEAALEPLLPSHWRRDERGLWERR